MAPRKISSGRDSATIFAALGDQTRLILVARLSAGNAMSISELTRGSTLTRQAVTKHLGVLESAGMVRSSRHGREQRFELDPAPITGMKEYLDFVSAQWNEAQGRIHRFVEE